jgi:adenylyltransferase/sulfurtransferase
VNIERFSRQILALGIELQERIQNLRVTIVGCGALGTAVAEILARLGVKKIRLVDADIVELSNLHRVHLFDENDIGKPKVIACAEKIKAINSNVEVEAIIDAINSDNVEEIIRNSDFVFDGLDNLYTKLLLNDACVKTRIILIHGGISNEYGSVKLIVPFLTSCLSCFIEYSSTDDLDTCNILGTTPMIVSLTASLQVQLMINYLRGEVDSSYYYIDARSMRIERININRNERCKACSYKEFPYINKKITSNCGFSLSDQPYYKNPIFENKYVKIYKDEKGILICYSNGRCYFKGNR